MIAAPAWGNRCIYMFVHYALPALLEAADRVNGSIRFLVHTDRPELIEEKMDGLDIDVRRMPVFMQKYTGLGHAHRQALDACRTDEAIMFMTADMIVSHETMSACEAQFAAGKKAVAVAGVRAIEGNDPPIGVEGPFLAAWGWKHRHPWINACTWGSGGTVIPSHMYFEKPDGVAMHGFHLHPIAVIKHPELNFVGTIDDDLLEKLAGYIHVVTDPAEMCVIELSPIWAADFGAKRTPNNVNDIVAWAKSNTSPQHRLLFKHHINIIGRTQPSPVVEEILQRLEGQEQHGQPAHSCGGV